MKSRAKAALRHLILLAIAMMLAIVGSIARMIRSQSSVRGADAPQNILLIRLDLLGDIVFALSAARAVKSRFPAARLSIVTLPQTASIAAASPDVDAVIAMDTNLVRSPRTLARRKTIRHLFAALRSLRKQRFEYALSLSGRTASLLALISRGGLRAGFRDEAYRSVLDLAVPYGRSSGRRRQHDTEFESDLVAQVLGSHRSGSEPRLVIERAAVKYVASLLDEYGISSGERLVVFQVGSGYGDFKRWPAQYFIQLASRLAEDNVRVVLAGSPAETELAQEIANASPAISLAGKTSLPQLVALLNRADVLVSGDSGPLHIASALGTAVVAIYGPTDPMVSGPINWKGQPMVVLRHDIACSPCYSIRTRAECPLGHNICMDLVTVDEVYESVLLVLEAAINGNLAASSKAKSSA